MHRVLTVLSCLAILGCSGETVSVTQVAGTAVDPPVINENFGGPPPFPYSNWWNLSIEFAPVDPASEAIITWIGVSKTAHPDCGPPPYGIPYVGVSGDQPLVPVTFVWYPAESDVGAPGNPPG